MARIQASPRLRAIAALMCLCLVAAELAFLAHQATTRHVYCFAHGHIVDVHPGKGVRHDPPSALSLSGEDGKDRHFQADDAD